MDSVKSVSLIKGSISCFARASRLNRLHSPVRVFKSRSAAIGQLLIKFKALKQLFFCSEVTGMDALVKGSDSILFQASKYIGRFQRAGCPFNSSNTGFISFHSPCEIILPNNPVHREGLNTL